MGINRMKEEWAKKFTEEFGIHLDKSELQFAIAFVEDLLKRQSLISTRKIAKMIKERLKYCEQQNGLPYCKNCGLGYEDLKLNKQ